ncbi:MAG: type IV secretory system conjugative DNA transfer family protein [Oscillospiraceae bacterium]|nr:type IV secretory system conjugative DNA transfer family protein [Oscillospiraceae bacterium]
MNSKKTKKIKLFLLRSIPYIMVGWVANLLSFAFRIAPGDTPESRLSSFVFYFLNALIGIILSFHWIDLLVAFGAVAIARYIAYDRKLTKKKYRTGKEYGSAEFGSEKDMNKFTDHDHFYNNVILTQTEHLTLGSANDPMDNRNKNVLLIGGSGQGKSYYWVEPNIMQAHSSYVLTDPKGGQVEHCGEILRKRGYQIKIFNTFDFSESMCYNPFAYFRKDKFTNDLEAFITMLIKGTGEKAPGGDEFWLNAEKLLYRAYISYIFVLYPEDEHNMTSVVELLTKSFVDGENKSDVDIMFDVLEFWLSGKSADEFKIAFPEIHKCGAFEKTFKFKPTEFEKIIAVIRSRNISACVVLQDISQLKALYEKQYNNIISNCDSLLFLGSSDLDTLKWISEKLGKETIDIQNSSLSKGSNSESYSTNQQRLGKELLSLEEIRIDVFIKWFIKAIVGLILVANIYYIASGLFALGVSASDIGIREVGETITEIDFNGITGCDCEYSETGTHTSDCSRITNIGTLFVLVIFSVIVLIAIVVLLAAIIVVLAGRIIEIFMYLAISARAISKSAASFGVSLVKSESHASTNFLITSQAKICSCSGNISIIEMISLVAVFMLIPLLFINTTT